MPVSIDPFGAVGETMECLQGDGALLVSGEVGNPMTIGWGMIGIIWGRPVFTVLVRPSRHSFSLLEELGEFTVNVPTDGLTKALSICGTRSGRDVNKVELAGLSLGTSADIRVPFIEECAVHYECRVIHKTSVIEADLEPTINSMVYRSGNLHNIYHGEIAGVYRH